mmetsp:Transcript_117759/g.327992  ORF Transcript_117759/g.327992 Transcript_117759/m.327992 type:complete len:338 (+) Transcript_117759:104-1117(+)
MWQTYLVVLAVSLVSPVDAHGLLTFPPSNRVGGSLGTGGSCAKGECSWFSNLVNTSVAPSLPDYARTIEPNITGGPEDVYRTSPWRAPGRAPVFGSGCGVAGGGPHSYSGAGSPPPGFAQGADGLTLPGVSAQVWSRGSEVEVAWAISANHGGGYSYRLCPSNGVVNEECFQRGALRFAGDESWIVYTNGTWTKFMRTTASAGTHPAGSEWARNPIPGCRMCPTYETCGPHVEPGPPPGSAAWNDWSICSAGCDGSHIANLPSCPAGTAQFPEPVRGLSSFGKAFWDFSIMDRVIVPSNLQPGDYVLSWRWDCEETWQVWQNCADVKIVDSPDDLVI